MGHVIDTAGGGEASVVGACVCAWEIAGAVAVGVCVRAVDVDGDVAAGARVLVTAGVPRAPEAGGETVGGAPTVEVGRGGAPASPATVALATPEGGVWLKSEASIGNLLGGPKYWVRATALIAPAINRLSPNICRKCRKRAGFCRMGFMF
jgi:hypothetical protein